MILLILVIFVYIAGILKVAEALYTVEKLEEELRNEIYRREIDDGK